MTDQLLVGNSHQSDEEHHPFDECPLPIDSDNHNNKTNSKDTHRILRCIQPQPWQTVACMKALVDLPTARVHFLEKIDLDDVFEGLMISADHSIQPPSPPPSFPQVRHRPWNGIKANDSSLSLTPQVTSRSPPRTLRIPFLTSVKTLGLPHFYKITIPSHLVSFLEPLVAVAEAQAHGKRWTRRTVADIPGGATYSRPVVNYITTQMKLLYQISKLWMDAPDLHKHAAVYGGAEHFVCDVTAHLLMSRNGGDLWLDDSTPIHLEQGECVLHPGHVRHVPSNNGCTRFFMVLVGFFEPPLLPPSDATPNFDDSFLFPGM